MFNSHSAPYRFRLVVLLAYVVHLCTYHVYLSYYRVSCFHTPYIATKQRRRVGGVFGHFLRMVDTTTVTLNSMQSFRLVGKPDLLVSEIQTCIKNKIGTKKTDIGPRNLKFRPKPHF